MQPERLDIAASVVALECVRLTKMIGGLRTGPFEQRRRCTMPSSPRWLALPDEARNSRSVAGAYIMPSVGRPYSTRARFTVNSWRPAIYSRVPSIGSIRKYRVGSRNTSSAGQLSSEMIVTPGASSQSLFRMNASASRSADVTGDPSALVWISRPRVRAAKALRPASSTISERSFKSSGRDTSMTS